jgi:integrase
MSNPDKYETEFLAAQKKESTKNTYSAALALFRRFYQPQGSTRDFLARVEKDHKQTSFLNQQRVAIHTMNAFVEWMQKETSLKAKTIRTYAGVLQSLVKYYLPENVKISTRYAGLSSPSETLKKCPWTPKTVSEFIYLMQQPIYECLVGVFFQSGIRATDAILLTYGDIKEEYEGNVFPLCLDLRKAKPNKPYLTFVGETGVKLLKNFLKTRQTLKTDDPLFPISISAVERHFNRRARELYEYDSEVLYTPGSFAASFRILMRQAGCPADFTNFWTGKCSTLQRSITRKHLRAVYLKYSDALDFPVTLPIRR